MWMATVIPSLHSTTTTPTAGLLRTCGVLPCQRRSLTLAFNYGSLPCRSCVTRRAVRHRRTASCSFTTASLTLPWVSVHMKGARYSSRRTLVRTRCCVPLRRTAP